MKTKLIARALATVVAVAAVAVGLAAAPASAGGWGCSGSQIDSWAETVVSGPLPSQQARLGTVSLYWDGDTGRNCAVNVSYGSFYGRPKQMLVQIEACLNDGSVTCTRVGDSPHDNGQYLYYAGPVSVPARGLCVAVHAEIDDPYWGQTRLDTKPVHCG